MFAFSDPYIFVKGLKILAVQKIIVKFRITYPPSRSTSKLHYVGYVIPVISYASQAWFANKTESKDIERIQRKATSWIISNWEISYKQRLTTLKLLPLSYYFELHDLLMLISLLKGSYNIKIPIKTNNNEGLLSTRQNELITIKIRKNIKHLA